MTIYIVSGLPRSGTSMMMLMLKQGGMDLCFDDTLIPDETNPNGFFELRRIDKNFSKVKDGQAVKVIGEVLEQLPDGEYKVLVMKRNRNEVVQSRQKMSVTHGKEPDVDGYLIYHYERRTEKMNNWLMEHKTPYLVVDYNRLMADDSVIDEVVQFLGVPLDSQKMKQVIDKNLYRNRL